MPSVHPFSLRRPCVLLAARVPRRPAAVVAPRAADGGVLGGVAGATIALRTVQTPSIGSMRKASLRAWDTDAMPCPDATPLRP